MRPLLNLVLLAAPVIVRAQGRSVDWPVYGGNSDNTHYSALNQITPANVSRRHVAWTCETRDEFPGSEMQANPIVIEGHTDAVPYRGALAYSNWELSADRANAARRVLRSSGVRADQVIEVRGCAATKLRDPQHPTDSTNRRVAILVKYVKGKSEPEEDEKRDGDQHFSPGIRPLPLGGLSTAIHG